MCMENGDSAIIPASRIEETDTSVVVTYMGKRTIINNAVLINVQTDKKYIKFAKLTNTKLGIIVEPIYSEKQEMPYAFSVSSKDNTKFTIEEFVDIFLDNLEVRTVISNGKYTFYRNNLIPTNWTLLSEKNLHSAYKKIQNAPVLSEKRINDKVIYQIDDYASRIPVFSSENIDEIVGILHFRDAIVADRKEENAGKCVGSIEGLLREAMVIPETKNIADLFRMMQKTKTQMVIVVDEYGQTKGVLAMEDILEEIVGNIQDEYDEDEQYIEETGNKDEYIIDGITPLKELEERFHISFHEEEFETLNGFMISKMDKIPEENEDFSVDVDGYNFKILSVEHKMIKSVLVTKKKQELQQNITIKNE